MAPDNSLTEEPFAAMLASMLDSEVLRCGEAIRTIANYDIPQERAGSFLRFHAFITDPKPAYIAAWRSDPATERRWYIPHVNGVLGDVRGALAAAYYHVGRLLELEAQVMAVLSQSDIRDRIGNSTIGLGGTRKLDFEYQAFVLAYRRCLDYLARSLSCYFKIEANSFRTFAKGLATAKAVDVARALIEAHARHLVSLDFVLATGRQSVRNRVAHYDFVSAGCFNVMGRGIYLVGGGEDLGLQRGSEPISLSIALTSRIEALHSCVDDMIDTFVTAARDLNGAE